MVAQHKTGKRSAAVLPATMAALRLMAITALLILPGACNSGHASNPNSQAAMHPPPLDTLTQRKFFFQHQSVGNNIISGIEMLARDARVTVPIMPLDADAAQLAIPRNGLAHSRGGKNRFPLSKIDSFVRQLQRFEPTARPDVAFMKFCYIDFNAETDVDGLFQRYAAALDQLEKQYPGIRFIHVTTPLTTRPASWKVLTKRLLGRNVVADGNNLQRERFNRLLRQRYPADRIFDLARYESTWPNGDREAFGEADNAYLALVPDYTEDGGHLNEAGRRYIAARFVEFLAGQP